MATGPGWELRRGDCLDPATGLASLTDGSVDHVITDPPYDAKTHKGARYGFGATSSKIPFEPLDIGRVVPAMLRIPQRWTVAFCALEMLGGYKAASGMAWRRGGFWRRTNGVPQFTGDRPGQPGEGIAVMHNPTTVPSRWNGSGRAGFWECPIVCNGHHPTTKPLALMEALVRDFTDPGDLVLDPFAGSGTTGVACIRLGRRFLGWERAPKYHAIALKRLEGAREQLTIPPARQPKPKQSALALDGEG